jgi:hypothetical protein
MSIRTMPVGTSPLIHLYDEKKSAEYLIVQEYFLQAKNVIYSYYENCCAMLYLIGS